eukprot:g3884.t1
MRITADGALCMLLLLCVNAIRAFATFEPDVNSDHAHANVRCDTTQGPLYLELLPDTSPVGARRFVKLVESGFFENVAFFRNVPGFLVQFGRKVGNNEFDASTIKDDHPSPELRLIRRGVMSFAGGGQDSRTNQLFFAYCTSCGSLGSSPWETPVARIVGKQSETVLDKIENAHKYGDIPPWGQGPDPGRIQGDADGSYLRGYPKLDYFKGCALSADFHVGLR